VNDDTPLARAAHRRWDPGDHPPPETLSAYLANELPPEEDDRIQEHLANCRLCAEMLLDLQRFLDPAPAEPSRQGVADFAAAAEWRELRRKIAPPKGGLLARLLRSPGLPIAAMLALALIWTSYRMVSLKRELAKPITDLRPTTFEASGSRKGGPAEPKSLKLGHVAAFETLSTYPQYRLLFRDQQGRIQRSVEDTQDDNGMITLFLPESSLPPGLYDIEVVGLAGSTTHPVRRFSVLITHP
jgi:hypothetical protein